MKSSKLIRLLKSFTAKEMRLLHEFAQSPLHNKHPRINKMVEILRQHHPTFTSPELTKEKMYYRLLPGKKFEEQKVSDLMSYLVKMIMEFLSFRSLMEDETLKQHMLLKALRDKKMNRLYEKNLKQFRMKIKKSKHEDNEYYYNMFLLETEADTYFLSKESRKRDESLQNKIDNLDLFYLSEKLKNSCEMLNRKNIVSVDYEIRMLHPLISYITENEHLFQKIPVIYIYFKILLTLIESEKEQHYFQLKDLLKAEAGKFTLSEANAMFGYAQNYCIKKVNSGDNNFLNELFSLFQEQLKKDLLYDKGHLSQWHYKNIVAAGLRLKKDKWVINFINEYKEKINPQHRETAYKYNLAYYFYNINNYDETLTLLRETTFNDIYYQLGSKTILLKIYYDLQETEPFLSLIDAFRKYLQRNKSISDYQREVHLNLVKYTKKVFELHEKKVNKHNITTQIKEISDQINATKRITNIDWLKEKILELEIK